jgi:hypothetical protein
MKATKAITSVMAATMSVAMLGTSLTAFADDPNTIDWTGKSANVNYVVELDALKKSDPTEKSMAADALNEVNSNISFDGTNYYLVVDFEPVTRSYLNWVNVTATVTGMTAKDANGTPLPVSFNSTTSTATVTIGTTTELYDMSSYDPFYPYALDVTFTTNYNNWFLNNIPAMANPSAYLVFDI